MHDIKQTVKDYIVENLFMGGEASDVEQATSFLEIGVLDSTGVIELVSFLEKAFGIKILDEEMIPENLDSLDSIERFVASKLR
jgi:acyl carrier protein